MNDVSFTPTFQHTPWVDNRDRVQASGPNGFNVRFTAIQTDLQALSTVVTDIGGILDTLGQSPTPTPHTLTLPPLLTATVGVAAWDQDQAGYAVRSSGQLSVAGIAPVVIPNGVTLSSLRASGQNSGSAAVRVSLMRAHLLGPPAGADRLARVSGDANPFDNTTAVDPTMTVVDTTVYRYFVLATADGGASTDTIGLSGFQITYLA
jgi:hypothetical protein